MKVELISYTNGADRLAAICAGTCVSKEIPSDPSMKGLRSAVKSGHDSVIEHVSFTFAVSGISRACSHQVVRHRLASYSQQSQRYVDMSEAEFVIPDSLKDWSMKWYEPDDFEPDVRINAEGLLSQITEAYKDMVSKGVPEEDARYILPNACTTNIIVTMNARELLHFLELRMCGRAQWEIRELACKMYDLANRVAPEIMKYAGPSCHFTGKCKEQKWCGQTPDEIRARIHTEIER